jgi:hypothetical protein
MRKYIPTGKPRGRPKKQETPVNITGNITEDNTTPEIINITPEKKNITPIPTQKVVPTLKPQTGEVSTLKLDMDIAIQERGENLEKLIKSILPATPPLARAMVVSTLELISDGCFWSDVLGITGLTQPVLNGYLRQHPLLIQVVDAAKFSGEMYRRAKREEIAHNHAVNGTDKPVYQQGKLVGVIKEFDHRLLEFLLKADNPGKYRDQAASVNIQNNVVSTVVTMHRVRPKTLEIRDDAPPTIKSDENPNESA